MFWDNFLEKIKQFSGQGSKMDFLYKNKVYNDYQTILVNIGLYSLYRLISVYSILYLSDA